MIDKKQQDVAVEQFKKEQLSELCCEMIAKFILTCQMSKECWGKLCSTYEQQHELCLALLMQRFYGATRDPEDDMGTHVAKMQNK